MKRTFVIAEIGINHNGDIGIAKKLIDIAKETDCDAVKFQKRTVDLVYKDAELNRLRKSPFGNTYREQKNALEFSQKQYEDINKYCKKVGILWFASCWDRVSVDFINKFNPPFFKIASSFIRNKELLKYTADKNTPLILSTGMSTESQIVEAIDIVGKKNIVNLMYCVSSYPSLPEEINLKYILRLKKKFGLDVGYSNHNPEIAFCMAAVLLGASMIEFHITLDRKMWGTDQTSSLEPQEVFSLLKHIRNVERSMGYLKKYSL